MKNPKLFKRNRDGIYTIQYYQNHKRKFKSLGTRDKIEASIKFSQITEHLTLEPLSVPKFTTERIKSTAYKEPANKFIYVNL